MASNDNEDHAADHSTAPAVCVCVCEGGREGRGNVGVGSPFSALCVLVN